MKPVDVAVSLSSLPSFPSPVPAVSPLPGLHILALTEPLIHYRAQVEKNLLLFRSASLNFLSRLLAIAQGARTQTKDLQAAGDIASSFPQRSPQQPDTFTVVLLSSGRVLTDKACTVLWRLSAAPARGLIPLKREGERNGPTDRWERTGLSTAVPSSYMQAQRTSVSPHLSSHNHTAPQSLLSSVLP